MRVGVLIAGVMRLMAILLRLFKKKAATGKSYVYIYPLRDN